MFFSVKDLEIRPAHFDVERPADQLRLDGTLNLDGPLKASGTVKLETPSIGEIRATGKLEAQVIAQCDRCLEYTPHRLASEFDLHYRPAPEGDQQGGGVEHLIDDDEAEMGFYEGDGVELDDILREQVYLDLPMQRLCSSECKGICPVCGQNRNKQDCGCDTSMVDDRWSALKQIQ